MKQALTGREAAAGGGARERGGGGGKELARRAARSASLWSVVLYIPSKSKIGVKFR